MSPIEVQNGLVPTSASRYYVAPVVDPDQRLRLTLLLVRLDLGVALVNRVSLIFDALKAVLNEVLLFDLFE